MNIVSKKVIVFIDLSDIQDDSVCYELDNHTVKRRNNNFDCFLKKKNK